MPFPCAVGDATAAPSVAVPDPHKLRTCDSTLLLYRDKRVALDSPTLKNIVS